MVRKVRKITDEIHQVGGSDLTAADDAAIYLLDFGGHAALVDAGSGRSFDRLLENVACAGVQPPQIEALLLTHCHFDHTGGANDLRERLGCTVVAHERDAPFIESGDDEVTAAVWYGATLTPCVVDRKLTGAREEIELGGRIITAVHIPGHSPGSVAYVVTSEGKTVVFAQDVHGPLHSSLLSKRADYLASLHVLLGLRADVLCEGHYGIFWGRRKAEAFVRSFLP